MADRADRHENRIVLQGAFGWRQLGFAIAAHDDAVARGYADITWDLSQASSLWLNGMLGLAAVVDRGVQAGLDYSIVLPTDRQLATLVTKKNWAHILAPGLHEPHPQERSGQFGATAFSTDREQKAVVDGVLEVVHHALRIDESVLTALEWSLNEITDNVLIHSDSLSQTGWAQATTYESAQRVEFAVCDAGLGIPASLRQGLPHLTRDEDALEEAVKAGVTRDQSVGQGNGLAGSLRIATATQGALRISSLRGDLEAKMPRGEHHYQTTARDRGYWHSFPGTLVHVDLRTDQAIDIEDVLSLSSNAPYRPWNFIDQQYSLDDDRIVFLMCEEDSGFGSRHAGKKVRTKVSNLVDSARRRKALPLIIDWAGVPLISSSFADEAIARLFVEMGPVAFAASVHNINLEPLVASLIDRAILQRAAHPPAPQEG